MDLSCIISSGDLELYVLGMLPEEEAYKIEQLALLFPEVRQELDRISETLEGFAQTAKATPSARIKENLMGTLKDLSAEEQGASTHTMSNPKSISATDHANTSKPGTVIPMYQSPDRKNWLQAATLIGLVTAIGIIAYLAILNRQNKKELASLEQSVYTINRNLVAQQRHNLAAAEMLRMFESDEYKKVKLINVEGKPKAAAQVFWNTKTSEVFIADISLPRAPTHKQYQLWAIIDGKPVDAGMLEHDAKQRIQKMKVFQKADAFAITLERRGGSSTPTMEEMYVMGKTT